ncbi:MAG: protease modulator HflC [Sphingomicrobium sp.]
MELARRRPLLSAIAAFILLIIVLGSFPIVPETKQAVVVRFGKPVRILNQYKAGHPIGGRGAGISWRIPFVENVVWIDKRVLDVDMDQQQVLSTDQLRLEVDAFARYRIVDPLRMYIRARSPERVSQALQPILGSELRNELGKRPFASLLSPEREGVMENVRSGLNRVARQYGAEIIDVRIKRADLPSGTPLDSAYERMRNAREQEARSIRAEAAKRAQIIRAEADAQAAKTYAASFGKDAGFYDFYRAMQSYQRTFIGDPNDRPAPSTIILSPQNDYLKEFSGRSR